MKKILAVVALLAVAVLVSSGALSAAPKDEEEPKECPAGTFWRGGCVSVTGCPYGDSIPMEDCDKFAPENQTPVVEETPVFEGK